MKKVLTYTIVSLLFLVGCKQEDQLHTHTYSSEWSYNEEYHWHIATCEHEDEVSAESHHKYGAYIYDENATTEEDGTKTRTCNICGYKNTVADEGSKLYVHLWDEGIITTLAGCTTEGVKTYTCTECDVTKTETIAATGHSFSDYISDNNATVNTDGTKTKTCKKCGLKNTIIDEGTKLCDHLLSENYDYTTDLGCLSYACLQCNSTVNFYISNLKVYWLTEDQVDYSETQPKLELVYNPDLTNDFVEYGDFYGFAQTYYMPKELYDSGTAFYATYDLLTNTYRLETGGGAVVFRATEDSFEYIVPTGTIARGCRDFGRVTSLYIRMVKFGFKYNNLGYVTNAYYYDSNNRISSVTGKCRPVFIYTFTNGKEVILNPSTEWTE